MELIPLLFILIALLFASAYFSASETALFSLPSTKLKTYQTSKDKKKNLIAKLLSRPQELLVTVFMLAGSMSTADIVESQTDRWWAWPLLPAFILYVISMVGETNRLPFDLPEAEGELVAGFMTEYSSTKFAWYFLAEYMNMINVSAVAATLFLGGWHAPWPTPGQRASTVSWWRRART